MTKELRKRRTQKRRHSYRKIRVVALTLAGLSFAMAVLMLIWSLSEHSASHRLLSAGYLAASFLAIVTYFVAASINPVTWLWRRATEANGDGVKSRSGMALLMVLLLMALLSGTLLHAMVQTRQALRAAEWRRNGVLLRAAALDGTLAVLRATAAGQPMPLAAPAESLQPSGIAVRVRFLPMDTSALPAMLRRPDLPVFGNCFEMSVEATQEGRSRRARGLVCQTPTGDLRVLGWTELL